MLSLVELLISKFLNKFLAGEAYKNLLSKFKKFKILNEIQETGKSGSEMLEFL